MADFYPRVFTPNFEFSTVTGALVSTPTGGTLETVDGEPPSSKDNLALLDPLIRWYTSGADSTKTYRWTFEHAAASDQAIDAYAVLAFHLKAQTLTIDLRNATLTKIADVSRALPGLVATPTLVVLEDSGQQTTPTNFDSGTDALATGPIAQTSAYTWPTGNADTDGLELESLGFGGNALKITQGDGQGDLTINLAVNQSAGAAPTLRYLDSKPTLATQGTSLGVGNLTWNGTHYTTNWTVNDVPEGRYFWIQIGAATTIQANSTSRVRFNYNRVTGVSGRRTIRSYRYSIDQDASQRSVMGFVLPGQLSRLGRDASEFSERFVDNPRARGAYTSLVEIGGYSVYTFQMNSISPEDDALLRQWVDAGEVIAEVRRDLWLRGQFAFNQSNQRGLNKSVVFSFTERLNG